MYISVQKSIQLILHQKDKFKDAKLIIKNRKLKNRQYNGQKKKTKTNNDL